MSASEDLLRPRLGAWAFLQLCVALGCSSAAPELVVGSGHADDDDAFGTETGRPPRPAGPPTVTANGAATETGTTTGPGCTASVECPVRTPICLDGTCVPCGQAASPTDACKALDPARPVCLGDVCVMCTEDVGEMCRGDTPICDLETLACVPCTRHSQCRDRGRPACHVAEGRCFAAGEATRHDVGDGGLQEVIDAAAPGVPHAIELTGTTAPREEIRIDAGRIVALVAVHEFTPALVGDAFTDAPTITVLGAATVAYLDGVALRDNRTHYGLRVTTGAHARVENTRIDGNRGGGVLVEDDADVTVWNSFVAYNGRYSEPTHGLGVDGGTAELLYTSLVFNLGDGASSIACDPASVVTLRNSLVIGPDSPSVDCALTAADSAFDEVIPGAGNVDVGPASPYWFADIARGDAHLTPLGHARFTAVGRWRSGDPPTDIDTDPRPQEDGYADIPGADVP